MSCFKQFVGVNPELHPEHRICDIVRVLVLTHNSGEPVCSVEHAILHI